MERPGRNDPCPCGSGRKYKKCCLAREAEGPAFAASVETAALPLLSRLARFAEAAAAMPLERAAREFFPFWGGRLDKAQGARVVDFLIFDHRPKHFGRRTVEQFALESGPALSAVSRGLLERWVDAPRRLYRLDHWSGGFWTCVDLMAEEATHIEAFDIEGSRRPVEGETAAIRALPVDGRSIFIGPPIGYPRRTASDVVDAVRRRHLDFVRSNRIVGMDDFLRLAPTALDEESVPRAGASTIVLPGA